MSESLRQACEWLEAWHTQYLGGPEEEVASLAALIEAARAEERYCCEVAADVELERLGFPPGGPGTRFSVLRSIRARGASPTGTTCSCEPMETGGLRCEANNAEECIGGRASTGDAGERADVMDQRDAQPNPGVKRPLAASPSHTHAGEGELAQCREVYERALAAERETIDSVRAALAQAVEERDKAEAHIASAVERLRSFAKASTCEDCRSRLDSCANVLAALRATSGDGT